MKKNYNEIYNNKIYASPDILEKRSLLASFLEEDIGTGDITSNILIPKHSQAIAKIICKHDKECIISGLEEAKIIFELCNCTTTPLVNDGSSVTGRTDIMIVEGNARSILKGERTALNFLMRMSGISTKTSQFIKEIKEYSKYVAISSTRKTAPGLRYFDKKAVVLGGGILHRFRLDSLILIKDNHISIVGSIKKAIETARSNYGTNITIECEVQDYSGIIEAFQSGATIIMLDNFSPDMVASSLQKMKELGIRDKVIIEISGGITIDNIYNYASSKPDIISIGSLTHSIQAIDHSLKIIEMK